MAKKVIIDIFRPPDFKKVPLNSDTLRNLTDYHFSYASMGRFALYHVLRALKVEGKMLVPAYICESIMIPLRLLNITPVFYDLEQTDLNASLDSIKFLSQKYDVNCVLVASMYGNPADLEAIESFCLDQGIKLIDDAAQSFGAKLNDRYIGTFGDAGFFSFSPGKPLAAHMGAFFRTTNDDYKIERTNHWWYHYLSYLDFFCNRLKIYHYRSYKVTRALSMFKRLIGKNIDIKNDDMAGFESGILGGTLDCLLNGSFEFRKVYFEEFAARFRDNPYFKVVRAIRGEPNNHKFVVLGNSTEMAARLTAYLLRKGIYTLDGYPLLTSDIKYLPNTAAVNKRVVEIPIENDREKMDYLFEAINNFKG